MIYGDWTFKSQDVQKSKIEEKKCGLKPGVAFVVAVSLVMLFGLD